MCALGLTPDRTALELVRSELEGCGVVTATAVAGCPDGSRAVVAGVVTHRQHPETARSSVVVKLEDETVHVNVVFSRGAGERRRHVGCGCRCRWCGAGWRPVRAVSVPAEQVEELAQ